MEKEFKLNDGAFVLSPVVQRYTFAKPLQGDNARELYKEVTGRVARDFKNAPAFAQYFKFDEETGQINGSNTFYGIAVDDELGKERLWVPTIVQAKQLDAAGKLSNGVHRDFGMAIYSAEGPNVKIADVLVREATKRGWKTPILAPFKALKLRKGGSEDGVSVGFSKNAQDVINGEEAEAFLQKEINYLGKSGALRLFRDDSGYWLAGGLGLALSFDRCRMDFACGEATTQNLESAITSR